MRAQCQVVILKNNNKYDILPRLLSYLAQGDVPVIIYGHPTSPLKSMTMIGDRT